MTGPKRSCPLTSSSMKCRSIGLESAKLSTLDQVVQPRAPLTSISRFICPATSGT
ncbi:unannotated protein [freshwater metagenome]|uniref:Unannotated protein n=1 Tax=freshwater metagenome TaxID=449393 RepID=A0A6J7QNV3_9ZZZZ